MEKEKVEGKQKEFKGEEEEDDHEDSRPAKPLPPPPPPPRFGTIDIHFYPGRGRVRNNLRWGGDRFRPSQQCRQDARVLDIYFQNALAGMPRMEGLAEMQGSYRTRQVMNLLRRGWQGSREELRGLGASIVGSEGDRNLRSLDATERKLADCKLLVVRFTWILSC